MISRQDSPCTGYEFVVGAENTKVVLPVSAQDVVSVPQAIVTVPVHVGLTIPPKLGAEGLLTICHVPAMNSKVTDCRVPIAAIGSILSLEPTDVVNWMFAASVLLKDPVKRMVVLSTHPEGSVIVPPVVTVTWYCVYGITPVGQVGVLGRLEMVTLEEVAGALEP